MMYQRNSVYDYVKNYVYNLAPLVFLLIAAEKCVPGAACIREIVDRILRNYTCII
jgi:hypothetical protein